MKLSLFHRTLYVLVLALVCSGSARVLSTFQRASPGDISSSETVSTSTTCTASYDACPTPEPEDEDSLCPTSSCEFDPDVNECAPRMPDDDYDDPDNEDPDHPDGNPDDPPNSDPDDHGEAPAAVSDDTKREFRLPGQRQVITGSNGREISMWSRPYEGSTTICDVLEDLDKEKECNAFRLRSQICQGTQIEDFRHTSLGKKEKQDKYATEHSVELQFVKRLLITAINGTLPSNAPLRTKVIPFDTFFDCFNQEGCVSPYTPAGSSKAFTKPADILFEILGSKTNPLGFFLVERGINNRKAKCFELASPVSDFKFKRNLQFTMNNGRNEARILQPIRETIGAWQYMNHADVTQDILSKRKALEAGISYISDNATDRELSRLKDVFDEMDQSFWDAAAQRCGGDLVTRIQDARGNYTEYIAVNGKTPANWKRVKKALDAFEDGLSSIQVPQALFTA